MTTKKSSSLLYSHIVLSITVQISIQDLIDDEPISYAFYCYHYDSFCDFSELG